MIRQKIPESAILSRAIAITALIASTLLAQSTLAGQPVSAKTSNSQKTSKHSKPKKSSNHEPSNNSCCKDGKSGDKKDDGNCCKKEQKAMKITLTKSGGIMGMNRVYEADSTKLTDEQAKKLTELYTESKILDLESKTTAGAADLFFYEFKIEEGKNTKAVHFDDLSLPESVRPLLSFLLEVTPGVNQR